MNNIYADITSKRGAMRLLQYVLYAYCTVLCGTDRKPV